MFSQIHVDVRSASEQRENCHMFIQREPTRMCVLRKLLLQIAPYSQYVNACLFAKPYIQFYRMQQL